ncbi:hypothetical protein LS74_010225 [Helicobacter magdeburgensis]|uniref:Uncharacterized protein n=1 Tax=Helicobacter magdeburgensis TaxID=471858 RepID=A0A4U8SW32_9HELI|nr:MULTISPECIES: protein-export chaperone SecB [Helicobacter]TLD91115.1 hypothetical protein LS74_010225 [Helicobacter magdeburgensis]
MGMQPSGAFRILGIQVKQFDFKQVGELLSLKYAKIKLGYSIKACAEKIDNNYILVVWTNLTAKQKENDVFYIKSTIMGKIAVQDGFQQEALKNMTAIIYSYLRPLVAQMTTMSKLPPIDLPPANFEDFEVELKE